MEPALKKLKRNKGSVNACKPSAAKESQLQIQHESGPVFSRDGDGQLVEELVRLVALFVCSRKALDSLFLKPLPEHVSLEAFTLFLTP